MYGYKVISRQFNVAYYCVQAATRRSSAMVFDGTVGMLSQAKPMPVVQTQSAASYQDTQQQLVRMLVKQRMSSRQR